MARRITKGVILNQPWARLVAEGVFPVLVRSIPTRTRGRVAIVAKGVDRWALVDGDHPEEDEFPQPARVGSVTIEECIPVPAERVRVELVRRFGKEFARFYPMHYLPKRGRAYLWLLRDPTHLKLPERLPNIRSRVWARL